MRMGARKAEAYIWALVGVIFTLIMARGFLEALSKWAPAPLGGRTGFAERFETLSGLQ